MIQARFTFPDGFLWGTATSSYQVEGQNTQNDWHTWEMQGKIKQNHRCGNACEWWAGRWREDLDRAAQSHQNAHRFSVEWSRIQPAPDRWDEAALDHYREMARGILDRGMTPMVTLHHFTNPNWIQEQGGWENDQVTSHFQEYVEKVAEGLKEYVSLWCPVNEPNVYAFLAYLLGDFPPGKKDVKKVYQVMINLVRTQAAAYRVLHRLQPEAKVGPVIHYRAFSPASRISPLDRLLSRLFHSQFNDFFPRAASTGKLAFPHRCLHLPEVEGTQDFLGINYYTEERVAFNPGASETHFIQRSLPPDTRHSETNYIALSPDGLFQAVQRGSRYQVPIYITENGIDDSQDVLRPRYLIEHLAALWKTLNHNCPVKGYFHWTLVDNFEWERGWTQRFGLWELDLETQIRVKRTSAELYAEICRENALTADMVARYAPKSLPDLFSPPGS